MRQFFKTTTAIVMSASLLLPTVTMAQQGDAVPADQVQPKKKQPEKGKQQQQKKDGQKQNNGQKAGGGKPQGNGGNGQKAGGQKAQGNGGNAQKPGGQKAQGNGGNAQKPGGQRAQNGQKAEKANNGQGKAENAKGNQKKPNGGDQAKGQKQGGNAKAEQAKQQKPVQQDKAGNKQQADQNKKPGGNQQGGNQNAKPGNNQQGGNQNAKPGGNQQGNKQNGKPGNNQQGNNQNAKSGNNQQGKNQNAKPGNNQQGNNQARQPGNNQPANANKRPNQPAPEASAKPNALAEAAANGKKKQNNDALKALGGAKGQGGKVQDVKVTRDDARRSDQDYDTDVRGERRKADKKDDDDHKGRDLARLALAGLAGYAVGSYLSNNRQVALNTGDRVVVTQPDGSQQLIRNNDTLLFQPGSNVQTEQFPDGSSITTVMRADGSKVTTIQDANMNVLRRTVTWPDGRTTSLIDDTTQVEPVQISQLPAPAPIIDYSSGMDESALRAALAQETQVDRRFTLDQIRDIAQVRALVAPLDIQSITFDTGSAAISPNQAQELAGLGHAISDSVKANPNEVYLIEGYTDSVGSPASNLALSDRRAESVALALSEYFNVPPENMVIQGYGDQFPRVQSSGDERANRRVAVRRITDLIAQ